MSLINQIIPYTLKKAYGQLRHVYLAFRRSYAGGLCEEKKVPSHVSLVSNLEIGITPKIGNKIMQITLNPRY